MLTVEMLSRIQFGFTISFHILFPSLTIGLGLFLVIIEAMWLKTKNPLYYQICKFWIKVFALTFGMGVVSGIAMEFQLGTNWAGFANKVGSILGPLFVYEVMTAFLIEAGALGIMIFGWKKVGDKLHFTSTLMVVIGTMVSAYWIMAANTWMQHPVGFSIDQAGKYIATDWWAIVFNQTQTIRWIHMMLAAYASSFFLILGISAYYLVRNRHLPFAKTCFKYSAYIMLIIMPLQVLVGDLNGVEVYKHQPLKTAAIEGLWETQTGAPLILFAIPSNKEQKNLFEFGIIPKVASLINTHQLDGELIGLKSVSPEDQPQVFPVFWSFRIMVGLGILMLLLAVIGSYYSKKDKLAGNKFLRVFTWCTPIGFIATWFGWMVAEIGRQPWVVYNLIRTRDAASLLNVNDVMISLGLIIVIYGIIFGFFYMYFLIRAIQHGPLDVEEANEPFKYMNPQIAKTIDKDSQS